MIRVTRVPLRQSCTILYYHLYRSDTSPQSSGSVKSSPTSFGGVKRSVGGDGSEGRRSGGSTKTHNGSGCMGVEEKQV